MGLECSALCLLSGLEINAAFMASARGSGKREESGGSPCLHPQRPDGWRARLWSRCCWLDGWAPSVGKSVWRIRRWRPSEMERLGELSCRHGGEGFFFFSGRAVLAGVSTVLLRVDVCFYSQACIVLPELIKPKWCESQNNGHFNHHRNCIRKYVKSLLCWITAEPIRVMLSQIKHFTVV